MTVLEPSNKLNLIGQTEFRMRKPSSSLICQEPLMLMYAEGVIICIFYTSLMIAFNEYVKTRFADARSRY